MAKRVLKADADEKKGRKRYVDQVGQVTNTTPLSVRKKQQEAWKRLERSLTAEQRKEMGLKPKRKKSK